MASERRFQIFVSSTYRDLKEERDKTLRTLAEFNYIPAGMEYFPAIDEEQFRFIKRVIDDSDYYVLIVAGHYGSLAPDGKSYTEKEYEYAIERGLPVCALLREDIDSLPEAKRETESQKLALIGKFRDRLSQGRLISYWKDENDLCLKLVQSLALTAKTYPAAGWIRGGNEEPLELLRRIQSLEDENKTLGEKVASLQERRLAISAEMDAFLSSKFEIKYEYKQMIGSTSYDYNGSMNVSWADLAEAFLPKFGAPVATLSMGLLIGNWIEERTGRSRISVKSELVDTVKITLCAFNLTHCYSANKVGGGIAEFIQATELGTRVLTLLKLKRLGLSLG